MIVLIIAAVFVLAKMGLVDCICLVRVLRNLGNLWNLLNGLLAYLDVFGLVGVPLIRIVYFGVVVCVVVLSSVIDDISVTILVNFWQFKGFAW